MYILKLASGKLSTGKANILTTQSNLRDLRWSPGQMVAHLASSGGGLNTGDLLGTGTISSPVSSTYQKSSVVDLGAVG